MTDKEILREWASLPPEGERQVDRSRFVFSRGLLRER